MDCEMCGENEAEYLVSVEGAKLNLCRDCADAGNIIRTLFNPLRKAEDTSSAPKAELEIIEGYGAIIAGARKRLGLPMEVLAERINEKLSFLERVEHEKTLPDEKVAHKLEKELGIKLLQGATQTSGSFTSDRQGKGMTLGDILEVQKKKKQE